MKRLIFTLVSSSLFLTACGQPQMMMQPMQPAQMNRMQAPNQVRGLMTLSRPKEEAPLVERNVVVERSPFDDLADSQQSRQYQPDPVYQLPNAPTVASPFDSPFANLPFNTFIDFRDHVRYGYSTTHEDYKYMDEHYARNHFNRYLSSSYVEVQRLYRASREQMKRFMMLDVLANSLVVDRQRLPYEDVHNPPAERHYKLFPTDAAEIMPTFGEIVAHNRNSHDVNYVRWDMYRAARYYQTNYRRIFGLVMEYGPNKRDAWRMVHREISAYAGGR